jgi:hypothetical protein
MKRFGTCLIVVVVGALLWAEAAQAQRPSTRQQDRGYSTGNQPPRPIQTPAKPSTNVRTHHPWAYGVPPYYSSPPATYYPYYAPRYYYYPAYPYYYGYPPYYMY